MIANKKMAQFKINNIDKINDYKPKSNKNKKRLCSISQIDKNIINPLKNKVGSNKDVETKPKSRGSFKVSKRSIVFHENTPKPTQKDDSFSQMVTSNKKVKKVTMSVENTQSMEVKRVLLDEEELLPSASPNHRMKDYKPKPKSFHQPKKPAINLDELKAYDWGGEDEQRFFDKHLDNYETKFKDNKTAFFDSFNLENIFVQGLTANAVKKDLQLELNKVVKFIQDLRNYTRIKILHEKKQNEVHITPFDKDKNVKFEDTLSPWLRLYNEQAPNIQQKLGKKNTSPNPGYSPKQNEVVDKQRHSTLIKSLEQNVLKTKDIEGKERINIFQNVSKNKSRPPSSLEFDSEPIV